MAGTSLRHSTARRVVVVGAALVVLVPGLAYANTVCAEPPTLAVSVRTPGATAGPSTVFSEISTDAQCTNGLISGGGIDQTVGVPNMTSNGNHVNGTSPSSDGVTEFLGNNPSPGVVVANDVTYWLGLGGTGGATQAGFSSTPFAVCINRSVINHTQVVESSLANVGLTVATCPLGTRLLGGGARTTPAGSGSMKPIASYPTYNDAAHDHGAKAAGDGNVNPDSWAAYGFFASPAATYAYAICSGTGINVGNTTVTVRNLELSGPLPASTAKSVTVSCLPGDGKLISGGGAVTSGNLTTADIGVSGSQGEHLNGTYPSDASGNPVNDGTTTAASWTTLVQSGGAGASTPTFTDSWAMCVTGA